jgi:hypothetical protein
MAGQAAAVEVGVTPWDSPAGPSCCSLDLRARTIYVTVRRTQYCFTLKRETGLAQPDYLFNLRERRASAAGSCPPQGGFFHAYVA